MKAMEKLYDRTRFLARFTIRVKFMLQTIWKERRDWVKRRNFEQISILLR